MRGLEPPRGSPTTGRDCRGVATSRSHAGSRSIGGLTMRPAFRPFGPRTGHTQRASAAILSERFACSAEAATRDAALKPQRERWVVNSWQIVHIRVDYEGARVACDLHERPAANGVDDEGVPNASALHCGGYATKRDPCGERPLERQAALLQILRPRTRRRLHERKELPNWRRPLLPVAVFANDEASTHGDRRRVYHQRAGSARPRDRSPAFGGDSAGSGADR
jgi:hypothetical protein